MTTLVATSLNEMLNMMADAIVESRAQNMVARDAGLSEKHVSQMLTGKVVGSLDSWQRMLDAAGVTLRIEVISELEEERSKSEA